MTGVADCTLLNRLGEVNCTAGMYTLRLSKCSVHRQTAGPTRLDFDLQCDGLLAYTVMSHWSTHRPTMAQYMTVHAHC